MRVYGRCIQLGGALLLVVLCLSLYSHVYKVPTYQRPLRKGKFDKVLFKNANMIASTRPWYNPLHCKMFQYNTSTSKDCMKRSKLAKGGNYFVFSGDSKARQLFDGFNSILGIEPPELVKDRHANEIVTRRDGNMSFTMDFRWTPFLETTKTVFMNLSSLVKREKPVFIVHHCGLWDIKKNNDSAEGRKLYTERLNSLIPYIKAISNTARFLWMAYDPIHDEMLDSTRQMLKNKIVELYNRRTTDILQRHNVTVWSSGRQMTEARFATVFEDWGHLIMEGNRQKAQILMNWICNRYLPDDANWCFTNY